MTKRKRVPHKVQKMKKKENENEAKLFLVVETLNVSTNIIN